MHSLHSLDAPEIPRPTPYRRSLAQLVLGHCFTTDTTFLLYPPDQTLEKGKGVHVSIKKHSSFVSRGAITAVGSLSPTTSVHLKSYLGTYWTDVDFV